MTMRLLRFVLCIHAYRDRRRRNPLNDNLHTSKNGFISHKVRKIIRLWQVAADKEPNGWPQADTLEGGHLDELGIIPPR